MQHKNSNHQRFFYRPRPLHTCKTRTLKIWWDTRLKNLLFWCVWCLPCGRDGHVGLVDHGVEQPGQGQPHRHVEYVRSCKMIKCNTDCVKIIFMSLQRFWWLLDGGDCIILSERNRRRRKDGWKWELRGMDGKQRGWKGDAERKGSAER